MREQGAMLTSNHNGSLVGLDAGEHAILVQELHKGLATGGLLDKLLLEENDAAQVLRDTQKMVMFQANQCSRDL